MFLVIRFARKRSPEAPEAEDLLLKCPFFDLDEEQQVIGLSRVREDEVWMVPWGENVVMHVDYNVDAR